MAELELDDTNLALAAQLLTEAASLTRRNRAMPMTHPDTYTGVGEVIGGFMRTVGIAAEAISDAAGETAAAVASLMQASSDAEAEITRALGPGFTG